MIAFYEAYKSNLLNFSNWKKNILSGIIVGIVALPLAMAFAIASGVKPEQGIYTAIIAGGITSIFGGSRVQISGPTGAFVVVLAAITAKYGVNGLQIATILAGMMLILGSILKMGNLIKYISYPVIIGFTSGIGVIILIGQWKDFFGLPVSIPIEYSFYQKLALMMTSLQSLSIESTLLSILSLSLLVTIPRFFNKLPATFIVMIVVTCIQYFFHFENVATIGSVFGKISYTLPTFQIPLFEKITLFDLMSPAFAIALLCAIESLLSATAADTLIGSKHDSNAELFGQGLSNIFAPFWGGFASTGAIARTVTNIKHGGNSPIAGIVHSIFLIFTLLFFAPLIAHIPFSVLAAILCLVAFNMSNISEFTYIAKRAPWYDILVMLITFFLTIFTDLITAVFVGSISSGIFFMLRVFQTIDISTEKLSVVYERWKENRVFCSFLENGIIYHINGPFFFATTEQLDQALAVNSIEPKFVIFCLKNVPFMDMSGLDKLSRVIDRYHQKNVKIYLCDLNKRVLKKFSKVGILERIRASDIFDSLEDILNIIPPKNRTH